MNLGTAHFDEIMCAAQGFLPVDLTAGNQVGDWFNMAHYGACAVLLYKEPGTAAQDPVIQLEQATNNAGAGAKALSVIERVAVKQAAPNLLGVPSWDVQLQSASDTYTNGTLGEEACIVSITVWANTLDANNGFHYLRASIDDPGATAAQIGGVIYFGYNARHGTNVSPL